MQSVQDFLATAAVTQGQALILITGECSGTSSRWGQLSPLLNEDQIDAIQDKGLVIVASEAPPQLASAWALHNHMANEDIQLLHLSFTEIDADGNVITTDVDGRS